MFVRISSARFSDQDRSFDSDQFQMISFYNYYIVPILLCKFDFNLSNKIRDKIDIDFI